jgi:ketosteroid isomerase-like protein
MMSQDLLTALAVAGSLAVVGAAEAAPAADKSAITATIKADAARMIAGINAHDVTEATAFDAPDVISMEAGRPSSVGAEADRSGLAMAFKAVPSWRLVVIDETVDVADSGEMAVYRCTANQEFADASGTPMTEKMNYIANFHRGADGTWRVTWSIVAPTEKPHKK